MQKVIIKRNIVYKQIHKIPVKSYRNKTKIKEKWEQKDPQTLAPDSNTLEPSLTFSLGTS